MTPNRHVQPLIDLSGWDRLPKRHEPLAGQQSLFGLQTLMPIVQACGADTAQSDYTERQSDPLPNLTQDRSDGFYRENGR